LQLTEDLFSTNPKFITRVVPGVLNPLKHHWFRILFVALLIFFSVTELFAGPTMNLRGRRGMQHSDGYSGPGICPQPRFTVKAPAEIFLLKNPLKGTIKEIREGESYFQREVQPTACKICHGAVGNGMGMMHGLNPQPRNFLCKQMMKDISDGQMYWIIKNGSQGTAMPAFADLPDEVVWKIILYIRSLEK
jgi:hypothetical protein